MIENYIVALCPATSGWKVVYAIEPPEGKAIEDAAPEDVIGLDPIACFALVEQWPNDDGLTFEPPEERARGVERAVEPIVSHGDYMAIDESENKIGIVGPGDDAHQMYYRTAIRYLLAARAKRQKATQ
jgi:hypothetical protein